GPGGSCLTRYGATWRGCRCGPHSTRRCACTAACATPSKSISLMSPPPGRVSMRHLLRSALLATRTSPLCSRRRGRPSSVSRCCPASLSGCSPTGVTSSTLAVSGNLGTATRARRTCGWTPLSRSRRWSGSSILFLRRSRRCWQPACPRCWRNGWLSDRGTAKPDPGVKRPKQIFVIPADGGEARLLVPAAYHPSDLLWAPDGRSLAFVGKPAREEPHSDVKVITRVRYKHDGEGFWDGRYKHLFRVSIDGDGSPQQLTSGDFDHADPAWSPDGRHLACVTNRTEEADFTNVTDVWIIPVDGGEARQLTGSIGPSSSPTWSPDGRAIAYYGHDNACMNATNTDVWIASAGGGDPVNLTAAADRSFEHHIITDMRAHPEIGGPVWSADGQRIFAIVAEGAMNQLAAVDARGAGVTVLISGRREIFGLAIGGSGDRAVVAASDPATPGDLWVVPLDGRAAERRLTQVNQAILDQVILSVPERFTYQGADDWPVEGWV